jgi:predicted small metal-binding protein
MENEKRVTCECGWSFQGPEDELIRQVQEHGREAHGLRITAEQALAQAVPV